MRHVIVATLTVALLVLAGCEPAAEPAAPSEPVVQVPETPVIAPPVAPVVETPAPPVVERPTRPAAAPAKVTLTATKDLRVMCHSSEQTQNGGQSGRLRTRDIRAASAELVLMDFDRGAIKKFLEAHAGKTVSATLVLTVREVQSGPGKVELASLDTASDWNEGTKSQQPAGPGEASAVAARTGEAKWAAADGREVATVRDLLYERKGDQVKTPLNANPADVAKEQENQQVRIELDAEFLKHVATSANCRGIVLFTRNPNARVDFFSREQGAARTPKLELAAN